MEILRYYYDPNCNKVSDEDIDRENLKTHDEIALQIIQENPELLEEYEVLREKGVISESVFLVMNGYIYVGGTNKYNMGAMYSSISLNKKTKDLMYELKNEGYYIYDIINNELTDMQKNQIRSWAKEGITREEIKNRVIKDMIIPLAPTKDVKNNENELDER